MAADICSDAKNATSVFALPSRAGAVAMRTLVSAARPGGKDRERRGKTAERILSARRDWERRPRDETFAECDDDHALLRGPVSAHGVGGEAGGGGGGLAFSS